MGLWHILKQLQLEVWKLGSRFLFGPLFHNLFPGQAFNVKPRHIFLTWIMSVVRLAHRQFSDQIVHTLQHYAMDPKTIRYLENVRLILEYFIPVVLIS